MKRQRICLCCKETLTGYIETALCIFGAADEVIVYEVQS
jgi:hypothetical protein